MDKPVSMSVKDYLMRVMSVRTNTPLKTIEAVVDFQMKEANEALQHNYSIEISGFCKFLFNHKKAQKKYEKNLRKKENYEFFLKDPTLSEARRKTLELYLENTNKFLDSIKPKLDGIQQALGRVEEQHPTSQGGEGIDRTDISEENKDL